MNESRSSKYHRARRRAGAAAAASAALLLAALMLSGGSLRLRDAVGGSVSGYVIVLALAYGVATLPASWYGGYLLERQYELSQVRPAVWMRDRLKTSVLSLAAAALAAEAAYAAMRVWPAWWWLAAAGGGTLLVAALTCAAPVLILPMFHSSRPLGRDVLRDRLVALAARAGVPVLAVHEWRVGGTTRRANAALVGAGATRRILVSDTLLAGYSDDEIEVVLAHEMGHHVHRDVVKDLALGFLVLAAWFFAARAALHWSWRWFGLADPSDVAGLPIVLLTGGAVSLLAAPLLNAMSRRHEQRADRFALDVTSRPEAFISAMRRMASQNLAEERPSRAARWLFHTHPTADERIQAARGSGGRASRLPED